MLRYFLNRLAWVIPTLWLISLLLFGLSRLAPGDPVRQIYGDESGLSTDPFQQAAQYRLNAASLQRDIPAFYFSIQPAVLPDTLHRIFPPERKERLANLGLASGHWELVLQFDQTLLEWLRRVNALPDSLDAAASLRLESNKLWNASVREDFSQPVEAMQRSIDTIPHLKEPFSKLIASIKNLSAQSNTSPLAVSGAWHGWNNQYHRWLTGFIRGELGRSIITRRQVAKELYPALCITVAINGIALTLAFLLAIVIGTYMGRYEQSLADRIGQPLLLAFYAMPMFWFGSLLILFFATPGTGLHWISGSTMRPWSPELEPFGRWFFQNAQKLLLPVVTLCLHVLAVLALQMRSSLTGTLSLPFIRTAYAKGLPGSVVVWRHGVLNALFPMIALLAQVLPAVFGGALVLEYLFQVPGMGAKTQEAFFGRDYPVLFAITMLSAVITILANLIADILYAVLDPRVRYNPEE
jgi:peptide/nickel transport system permease protein